MNRVAKSKVDPTAKAVARLLEEQFGGHIWFHTRADDSKQLGVLSSGHARGKALKDSNVLRIERKIQVYSASCGSAAQGDLSNLKEAGMVVLLKSSLGTTFHVELTGHGEDLVISRVSSGVIAKELGRAMERATERWTRKRRGSELRVLRVPSMHVSAIWVHHSKNQDTDVFVPYTPNFARLQVGRTYHLRRIRSLLKRRATEMILRWYDGYEKGLAQRQL